MLCDIEYDIRCNLKYEIKCNLNHDKICNQIYGENAIQNVI